MLVNVTIGTPGQLKPMAIVTLWGDSQLTNGTNIVDGSSCMIFVFLQRARAWGSDANSTLQ